MLCSRVTGLVIVLSLSFTVAAQSLQEAALLKGDPPAPMALEVIARDAVGHATVRAITCGSEVCQG